MHSRSVNNFYNTRKWHSSCKQAFWDSVGNHSLVQSPWKRVRPCTNIFETKGDQKHFFASTWVSDAIHTDKKAAGFMYQVNEKLLWGISRAQIALFGSAQCEEGYTYQSKFGQISWVGLLHFWCHAIAAVGLGMHRAINQSKGHSIRGKCTKPCARHSNCQRLWNICVFGWTHNTMTGTKALTKRSRRQLFKTELDTVWDRFGPLPWHKLSYLPQDRSNRLVECIGHCSLGGLIPELLF